MALGRLYINDRPGDSALTLTGMDEIDRYQNTTKHSKMSVVRIHGMHWTYVPIKPLNLLCM